MVGMGHLQCILEQLEAAADDALFADGQQLAEVISARVKEYQGQRAGGVVAQHAVGLARIARRLVLVDGDFDAGDPPGLGRVQGRGVATVDQALRQMPEQVDDMRSCRLLNQLRQLRPDSGQAGDGGEQGKKELRAHGKGSRARGG